MQTLNDFHRLQYRCHRISRAAAGKMTSRSVAEEAGLYRKHIAPRFGEEYLNTITLSKAEEWRDTLLAKGLSSQTVIHAARVLRQIVAFAHKAGTLYGTNPLDGLTVQRRRGDKKGFDWVNQDELGELFGWDHCLTTQQRAAIRVAVYTGLRLNEIKALHWGDVHIDTPKPYIMVRYGSVPSALQAYFGPTKSGDVVLLDLLPQAVAALHAWQECSQPPEYPKETSDHGIRDHQGIVPQGGLVFGNHESKPYAAGYDFGWSTKDHTGCSVPQRAFGRHVRFHDLRHTFCSHLAMGSWTNRPLTLLEIKSLARHSSTKITERYTHLATGHLAALALPLADKEELGTEVERAMEAVAAAQDALAKAMAALEKV